MRKSLTALQQRFMRTSFVGGGSGASEPSEFDAKYARLLQARDTLRKVESSVRAFIKKARSLSKAGKEVAKAMGTPDADIKRIAEEVNQGLNDEALLDALTNKLKLLDDIVKQRKKLDEIKGVRDHHSQRLSQIKTKRAAAPADDVKLHVEEAKWQAKLEHSQKEYDELLQEVTEALDFIDAQTKADGPWALVAVELQAFKETQANLFRGIEGLFVGAPPGSYRRDPAAEKAAVEAEHAVQTAELLQGSTGTGTSTPPSEQASNEPATSSTPEKKPDAAAGSASRPKPPKPPGAESDDDDDDDDDE